MLHWLGSTICGGICLWKVIRIFILNVAVFPKTFKSLLITSLELILANLSRGLTWETKSCFLVGVLNAVINIVPRSLPLNEWVLYWIWTFWYNSVFFRNLNAHFILHFKFDCIELVSIIIILYFLVLFDPVILILIYD